MDQIERMKINNSIKKELGKNPKIRTMFYLQEHGETSAYKIAKDFGWDPSRAHAIVRQLKKSHSITVKPKVINGRAVNLIKLVSD